MKTLHQWIQEQGWEIAKCEKLSGGHAAELFQLDLIDARGRLLHTIYKKLAPAREAELFLYQHILAAVPVPIPKLLGIIDTLDEKGLLLEFGGDVLKPIFANCTFAEKKSILAELIAELTHLHADSETNAQEWLATGIIFTYPYESSLAWGEMALDEMAALAAGSEGLSTQETVSELRAIFAAFYPRYQAWTNGRATLTHGDPHLENILVGPGGYRFIDWEWTCVSLPQRDLAILLQDVMEPELQLFAWEQYKEKLAAMGWESGDPLFAKGFYASMVDNTLMMLGWDIQKFRSGFLAQEEMNELLQRKIGWIRDYYEKVVQ